MLMCLGWSTSPGQALMSTLNYPCGWEPSQPRHNDAIIRGALYHWANSPSCGPPTGRPAKNPINLFRPRIISSWAWSYFTVKKRKKTSISKLSSDIARFFLGVKQCQTKKNTQEALALPEKEVIQPHLPVRLPCYDFTPVTSPAFGIPPLAVKVTTSGMASSHSVTGGVYKARERIHRRMADRRLLAIPASCRRVAACNPNWGRVFGVSSPSRDRDPLSRPL